MLNKGARIGFSLVWMLLLPPLMLLAWAHFIRPEWPESDIVAMGFAGIVGLVGIAIAPWQKAVKAMLVGAYISLSILALPLLGLLAVCSTGDCL